MPAFENAVSQLAELSPDLILLDINLPFRSGFEICKEIKAKHLGAVLILTARDKLQDELHALGLGADDYLTKPCNMERLLARTKIFCAAERSRCSKDYSTGAASCLIQILYDICRKTSYVLPQNEGKILLALLKNSPNLVSKNELFHTLWGTAEFIDENALQVNFTRLRKRCVKLGLRNALKRYADKATV